MADGDDAPHPGSGRLIFASPVEHYGPGKIDGTGSRYTRPAAADPSGSTQARARVIPAKPASVRERVDFIVELMTELEWDGRRSVNAIAEAWGLDDATIRGYSAEASRHVIGDEDTARRDITAGCRRLFSKAVASDDAKAARAVGELWAQVSGAKAPEKHQHGLIEDVTPGKAREVMRGFFGAVTPNELANPDPPELTAGEDPDGAEESATDEGVDGR